MPSNPDIEPRTDSPDQDSAATYVEQRIISTQGGDYAEGSIDKRQGTFVNIDEEQTYKVAGLPNPYLGLKAFTAKERDIFAGRERVVESLVKRLSADDGDRLLFLVGASGSGKSSLAQAGLLPALEAQLPMLGWTVQTCILKQPGDTPATTLTRQLHALPAPSGSTLLLLLIDQFEELFTQSNADEAERALGMLIDLAAGQERPSRIIATMRSDFLPQLVADARFEPYERNKVVVRAMRADELQDAIQRPIQICQPAKCMQAALVKRLAHDAAQDAAYLPLLQVTLVELWRDGDLRIEKYQGLADAIQRRADEVYAYSDYDGLQQEERPPDEQQAMVSLLLDLVRVAPGEEQREVRWRRSRAEVAQGDPQRERLLTDLTAARLLRTDRETWDDRAVETVDIVHEALLNGWPRLREAIAAKREHLGQREHFLQALREWRKHEHHDDYLLRGVRLTEAEALLQRGDSAMQGVEAQQLYAHSIQQRDAEREQELERARQLATEAEARVEAETLARREADARVEAETRARLEADARAADQRSANTQLRRRSQWIAIAALIALLFAGAAGWFGTAAQNREAEARDNAATAVAERQRADAQAATAVAEQQRADSNASTAVAEQQRADAQAATAVAEQQRADAQAATAVAAQQVSDQQIRISRSRELAAQSNNALNAGFPQRSGLLAVEALNVSLQANESTLPQAWQSLSDASMLFGGVPLPGYAHGVSAMKMSPDGSILAIGRANGQVELWNVQNSSAPQLKETLNGHTDRVNILEFSKDGQTLVTGSNDYTARVWRLNTPDPQSSVLVLRGHEQIVNRMALSANGQLLVTGSWDRTVRVWNLSASNPQLSVRVLRGHVGTIGALALTPDGRTLVTTGSMAFSGLSDPDIRVWDLTAPDPQQSVRIFNSGGETLSLAMTPDARRLVAGKEDNTVQVWDLTSANPEETVRTSAGHRGAVTSVALLAGGNRVIAGSMAGTIHIWDTETLAELHVLRGHQAGISALALSADEKMLITGSEDHTVRIWDLSTHYTDDTPRVISNHESPIQALALSPDASTLVVGSSDDTVQIWDLPSAELSSLRGGSVESRELNSIRPGYIRSASIYGDATQRLLATIDGSRIDVTSYMPFLRRNVTRTLSGGEASITSAVFAKDGNTLVTAGEDGTVRVWDLREADPMKTVRILTGHAGEITRLALSNNGILASGSSDGVVQVWRLASDRTEAIQIFDGHEGSVGLLMLSDDGHRMVTKDSDATRIWELAPNGRPTNSWVLRGSLRVDNIYFSGNGHMLATIVNDYEFSDEGEAVTGVEVSIRVWDFTASPPGQKHVVEHIDSPINDAVFTTDGSTLVTGHNDATVRVWNLRTTNPAETVKLLRGHEAEVTLIALGPDDRTLVSQSRDGTLRVWDLEAPHPEATVRVLQNPNEALKLASSSIDARTLLVQVGDHSITMWPLDAHEMIFGFCQVVGRNLTITEWQQHFGTEPYRRTCPNLPDGEGSEGSQALKP
jgi:WD40 repeat protein